MLTEADASRLEERIRTLEVRCDMLERMLMSVGGKGGGFPGVERADDFEPVLLRALTTKQHVALQMLMAGKSNLEIAQRFGVTENGAKVYLRAIYKKFGVNTRSQAVMAVYDEWEQISEGRYVALSKGVPKDWHIQYLGKSADEDPYLALYAFDGGE